MTNFVGNCDPKIQPGVFANGGRLLSVAGGREIGEAQQVAVRQVVRADVVSGKRKKAVRVSAPESLSRLPLSLSLSRLLARSLVTLSLSLSLLARSLIRYALSLSLSLARSFVTLSLSLSLARSLARSLKRRSGGEWSSPRDEDTYVEVIRMICILGIQLVGPGSEAGQCIFGVGTNGQIYLRENHFEMEWDHFGILILDNARIIREILIFEICIFYIIRYNKFFKLKKKLESIGN